VSETPRTAVAVALTSLRRSYGSVQALDDFSMELHPGELVALLGPSGCGKTTALRALSGLEDIDSGSILVGGAEVSHVPANKRDMAMVFQSYSLFPHMTVAENIEFALELRKVPAGRRKDAVGRNLDLVGLGSQSARYPHQLSGGQQQRVALARALAVQPQVLLLDEPLSALDAKVRVQLRDEIKRIQTDVGITTLFVTHDQEEALVVADRLGVMQSGKLMQIGTPEEIYDRPASAFVADFIGLTNRLPGIVSGNHALVLGQPVPLLPGSVTEREVTVLVRPENVRPVPISGEEPNGHVLTSGFLGSTARLQVRTSTGHLLIAQVPVSAAAGLLPGQAVRLELAPVAALAV